MDRNAHRPMPRDKAPVYLFCVLILILFLFGPPSFTLGPERLIDSVTSLFPLCAVVLVAAFVFAACLSLFLSIVLCFKAAMALIGRIESLSSACQNTVRPDRILIQAYLKVQRVAGGFLRRCNYIICDLFLARDRDPLVLETEFIRHPIDETGVRAANYYANSPGIVDSVSLEASMHS